MIERIVVPSTPSFGESLKAGLGGVVFKFKKYWFGLGARSPPPLYPPVREDDEWDALVLLCHLAEEQEIDFETPRVRHEVLVGDQIVIQTTDGPEQLKYDTRFRKRVMLTLVQECKNKFPLFRRSEANRLVARKFLYERMIEIGMRPAHIRGALDMAVELCFTADATDREVEKFTATLAYRNNLPQVRYKFMLWRLGFVKVDPPGFTTA